MKPKAELIHKNMREQTKDLVLLFTALKGYINHHKHCRCVQYFNLGGKPIECDCGAAAVVDMIDHYLEGWNLNA